MVGGREEVNGLCQDTLALAWASAFTNQGLPLTTSNISNKTSSKHRIIKDS